MVNYLSAEGLGKSYNDRWLFQNLTIGIGQGEKFALVGYNGAGKSTLLKILAGSIQPDQGLVSLREGVRTSYLSQQAEFSEKDTIRDILFHEGNEVAATVREYEYCLHHPDVDPNRFTAVLERMEDLKAWSYDAKVQEVIGKLGIPDMDRTIGELSGGQRRRIYLAQVILQEPDLIILDEPTNHLDLPAIEWLETFLSGQQVTLLMVTHDRYFLDNVANVILELDRGVLYRHNGNYAYYLEKKSEREENLRIEVTRAKNLLRKELEWMRRQPKARGTKAKYRIDAYYDLKEKASIELKRDTLSLEVAEARQGGKVLEVYDVKKAFGNKELISGFNYIFRKGEKIGVVGQNGSGKSTFLNLLTGRIKPDSGQVVAGVTTKFGYFTQDIVNLNPENRVIEEVKDIAEFITLSDGTSLSASKFLETFLFSPEKQYIPISKLSGGEKKRLQLLKVLITNPNFLVLDEPTNDFDLETMNVLEDFLTKFNGCLLLVSHDRYFMDRLVDFLFVFEGDGTVKTYNGNYSDYRLNREDEETEVQLPEPAKPKPEPTSAAPSKKPSMKEKLEYEELEKEIARLEEAKRKLESKLSEPGLGHDALFEVTKEIGDLAMTLDVKTTRWLELAERIS